MAHNHESHFGPSSELIDLTSFLDEAEEHHAQRKAETALAQWDELDPSVRDSISSECDVSGLRTILDETWRNPSLAAHIMKSHNDIVASIHDASSQSNKRKRKRGTLPDPAQERPEIAALQNSLDSVRLKCWPLTLNSALFIRPSKNSDHNALSEFKFMSDKSKPNMHFDAQDALLTIAVYNPISWSHSSLSRSSQHVVLASQTLGDLYNIIPCPSKELPEPIVESDRVIGYDHNKTQNNDACVLCIEGIAYGDGKSELDYADKLLLQLENIAVDKRPHLAKSPTSMHETLWTSLSIRINQPYWLIHQGDCNHYVVVEQIRLQHPSDPSSGYPLTTQITPPLLHLCRACAKVPATVSVVGDMRLGESPCVFCDCCWRSMGLPRCGNEVLVVPLPRHELGWRSS